MPRITERPQFTRDRRRQKQRGRDIEELIAIIDALRETGTVPRHYRPHRLSGEWQGTWECHVNGDWLLIYAVRRDEIILIRTGTHADLFEP